MSSAPDKYAQARLNKTLQLGEESGLMPPYTVSYSDVGDPSGYPVFLTLGVDSHRFFALPFDASAKNYLLRLICIDRPGRGQTSKLSNPRRGRVLAWPEILRGICTRLKIRAFALVGQSLGAAYALRTAQRLPAMIATTVYCISPWIPLHVEATNPFAKGASNLPAWLVAASLRAGMALPRLAAALGSAGSSSNGAACGAACSDAERQLFEGPAARDAVARVAALGEQDVGLLLDALTALGKFPGDPPDLGFRYEDTSLPVRVLHGRADTLVPFAAAAWMERALPACSVTCKIAGTHALLYDFDVINSIFGALHVEFAAFVRSSIVATMAGAAPLPGGGGSAGEGDESNGGSGCGGGGDNGFSADVFPVHGHVFERRGWLWKRSGFWRRWELSYFVLQGDALYHFAEPNDVSPRKAISLTDCRVARAPEQISPPGGGIGFSGSSGGSIGHGGGGGGGGGRDDGIGAVDRLWSFTVLAGDGEPKCELAAASPDEMNRWAEAFAKAARFRRAPAALSLGSFSLVMPPPSQPVSPVRPPAASPWLPGSPASPLAFPGAAVALSASSSVSYGKE
ncbi:unnamed protein product [Phaeothamnion confervicola]